MRYNLLHNKMETTINLVISLLGGIYYDITIIDYYLEIYSYIKQDKIKKLYIILQTFFVTKLFFYTLI